VESSSAFKGAELQVATKHQDAFLYQLKPDRYSSHSVILSYLQDGRGKRLLDVGAAQGDMAKLLHMRGYDVTAIEGDPKLAEIARTRVRNVIVADLDDPIPDWGGPFDVVVYGDVLEHLKDPLSALININRQLKPAGVVVVSVPNSAHAWVRLQMCFGHFEYAERGILDKTHLRFFTLASVQRSSGSTVENNVCVSVCGSSPQDW
jgi:O-antigen biosynthesis protein